MRELYIGEDGAKVFDLDDMPGMDPGGYTKSAPEQQFLRDVTEFSNAGFRIASKDNFPTDDGPGRKVDFDKYAPDAILVANGQQANGAIDHGMIFLHAGIEDREGAFLYMALDKSAKDSAFEKTDLPVHNFKGDDNGVFFEMDDGNLFGYMRLERNESAGPGQEYDDALQRLRELDLPTIPMPMKRDVVQMVPHFGKEGMEPEDLSMEKIAEVLGENFRDTIDVFDMPEDLMKIAQQSNPNNTLKVNEPDFERSRMLDSRPAPSIGR